MTIYYVDKRAAIGGDGSEEAPWRTPQEAAEESAIGDTIHVVEGSGPYVGSLSNIKADTTWYWHNNEHSGLIDLNALVENNPSYVWKKSGTDSMGYYLAIVGRGENLTYNGDFLKESNWSILGTGATLEINYNYFQDDLSYSSYKIVTGSARATFYQQILGILSTKTYHYESRIYLTIGDEITISIRDSGADGADTVLTNFIATETGFVDFAFDGIALPLDDSYLIKIFTEVGNAPMYVEYIHIWEENPAAISEPEIKGLSTNLVTGVVDGWWWASSHSLTGVNPADAGCNNWAYTDADSLGFSTFYVYLNGGIDPTGTGATIMANNTTRAVVISAAGVTFFNPRIIGGQGAILLVQESFSMWWGVLKYVDTYGINFETDSPSDVCNIVNCQFYDTGHQSLNIAADNATYNFYGNTFVGSHLILRNAEYDNVTVNLTNNNSNRLVAGAIQWDDCPNATLNEGHNQFRIDPDSHHKLKLAHNVGTSYWVITAATDLPSSQDTTLATTTVDPDGCGVSPKMIGAAIRGNEAVKLLSTSPCIDSGDWITGVNNTGAADPWGKYVHKLPNIGADQGAGAPKSSSGFLRIGRR